MKNKAAEQEGQGEKDFAELQKQAWANTDTERAYSVFKERHPSGIPTHQNHWQTFKEGFYLALQFYPPTPLQPSGTGEQDAEDLQDEKLVEELKNNKEFQKVMEDINAGEEGEKEVTASTNFYQVCTCPESKDTCPIHGKPLMGTVTTSSTEMTTAVQQYCAYCSEPINGQHFYSPDTLVFCSKECLMEVYSSAIESHRDSEEDKATPEEIKAIAETSLILYIRKLQEVNANAIQKIVEELRNKATLKQTIAQQEQTIKELQNEINDKQRSINWAGEVIKEQEQRIKDLEQKNGFQEFRIQELEKALKNSGQTSQD